MSSPQANFFGIFTLFGQILGGVNIFWGGVDIFQHWGFHDADDLKQPRPT